MRKNALLLAGILAIFIAACALLPAEATPAPYSPYYFVTVGPDATATPTPFQPLAALALDTAQTTVGLIVSTPTPPPPTATPFPTPTTPPTSEPVPEVVTDPQPVLDAPESVTFLLLGSDTRGGASFRTDTILVAAVRPKDGQVSLISFPRDLWVNIPTVGMQRINTAYQFGEYGGYTGGGAGLLKDTILYNFGLQIDHTAMVDFDGFRRIVDTLNGIDVPVACPYTDWRLIDPSYDPENENNWALYTAGPGLIHMDGDLSLWYARSRSKSNDFDRGRRQQEVIRAIYGQALRSNTLSRLPQLYNDFSSTITTDLGLGDILKLSPLALHLTNADIRSYYIAGNLVTSWITPGGAYVLLPNTELIQAMLGEALAPSPRQQERQAIKVEIQNGSSYDGWEALAAERLNYAGYATTTHPADNRQHIQTLLYDLTPSQERDKTASLLAILNLPDSALVSAPGNNSEISYVLIVGNDYSPCFDPHNLMP
jgi:polyisoprenyl-teichoic acid--peptidoglycan teichoic acid transferase